MLPRALRPSVLIRRKALMSGIFGPSTFWKVVALVVFGSSTLRRVFGRTVEVVEVTTFKGPDHIMQVETFKRPTRRDRRRARAAASGER